MSDSPAVILFDINGNPIGISLDGATYRLKVDAKETIAANATNSNVAGNASSVTLLAANTSRLGATIFNESTADLYIKLGSTASLTDYTVKLISSAYYEVPYNYVGRIDGIWSVATGNARIAELT